MLEKNQRLTLACTRLGADLEGIGEYEGQALFIPGALPGEQVEVQVVKAQPRYAFGKLLSVLTPSPDRVTPPCPVYGSCGGCSGQHMAYSLTLAAKRQQVEDCLARIGGFTLKPGDIPPVLGAAEPYHSRNKTSLPVGGTREAPLLGFYRKRSHQLVPIRDCPIAMPGVAQVVEAVEGWMKAARVEPYQEATGRGLLRHVVVRTNRRGDVMVLLVATRATLPHASLLVEALQGALPGFRGLHVSVNAARSNVILGKTCERLYGEEYLTETLLGLTFQVSPLSFFQVNPSQTEALYRQAIAFARLQPGDLVVDAYAGAGTIALTMAGQAGQVVGIEVVPQAVDSARQNAARNQIENVQFYTAPVEEKLPQLVAGGLRPQVVVLDPPRKGVDPVALQAVLAAAPQRVVYISCHVPTQARDMALLREGGYRLEASQPVDMFCYAGGVENVCLLERA